MAPLSKCVSLVGTDGSVRVPCDSCGFLRDASQYMSVDHGDTFPVPFSFDALRIFAEYALGAREQDPVRLRHRTREPM